MKKSMHVKQKINKPKVDKHVDFVIYINTTGEGGFLDNGSVKDMCKYLILIGQQTHILSLSYYLTQ